MLGSRVRASWRADKVQAQRTQHEPRRPLLCVLLQQLPVHAALLCGRASSGSCMAPLSSLAAGGLMSSLQLLCMGHTSEHQAQAGQQQRLQKLLELGVFAPGENMLKRPRNILPASHCICIEGYNQPQLLSICHIQSVWLGYASKGVHCTRHAPPPHFHAVRMASSCHSHAVSSLLLKQVLYHDANERAVSDLSCLRSGRKSMLRVPAIRASRAFLAWVSWMEVRCAATSWSSRPPRASQPCSSLAIGPAGA